MTSTSRRLTALTAALLAVAAAIPASAHATRHPTGALERIADEAVVAGIPGVVVRVDDGRGPVVDVVRQALWTVPDHRLSANDRFMMGSNTKTMTAVLVLQLVGEHRLALDDTIEEWLPGVLPNGRGITLRMLLNHTSGLADYAYAPEVLATMSGNREPLTTDELLALGRSLPVEFAPGQGYHYSNIGYVALGEVLEKVTGRGFPALVRQRITRPLGLRDTYVATGPVAKTGFANGYEPDAAHLVPILPPGTPEGFGFAGPEHDEHVNVTALDQSWGGAAGAVVSTTADWARFDSALMSGRLFPRRLLAEFRTTVAQEAPERRYGLGVEEYRTPCGTVWGHDGALPGFRSNNYTDLTGRRTVSVLSTSHFGLRVDPVAGEAETRLVHAAVCAMLGKPVPADD